DGVWIEPVHAHAEMVDGRGTWRRVCAAAAASPAGKHEELPTADAEHWSSWPLIRLDSQTEELLVELVRAGRIGDRIRTMAPAAKREHALFRRRFRRWTDVAQGTGAAAIPRILQLDDQAVRVAEVELGGARFVAARFRPAHANSHPHRTTSQ